MSEAFVQSPHWNVLRIDNNMLLKDVPMTVIMDIRNLDPTQWTPHLGMPQIDYVHASPPCTEFSTGYGSPRSIHQRNSNQADEYLPDMTWLMEALRIIEILKPKHFSIENVKGASKWFTPLLGEPSMIIGSFMFWGTHPIFSTKEKHNKTEQPDVHSKNPLRANIRGRIPFFVSEGMKRAIDSQTSILDF